MRVGSIVALFVVALVVLVVGCRTEEERQTGVESYGAQVGPEQQPAKRGETERMDRPADRQRETTAQGQITEQDRQTCPMLIQGTKVQAEDTDDGIALTFMGERDRASDLQKRVEQLADLYRSHDGRAQLSWREMGAQMRSGSTAEGEESGSGTRSEAGSESGTGAGARAESRAESGTGTGSAVSGSTAATTSLPRVEVEVENIDQGARLELTPRDEAQLQELRRQVRQQQRHFSSGMCPVRQHGDQQARRDPGMGAGTGG